MYRFEQPREMLPIAAVTEDDDVALGFDRAHRDAMQLEENLAKILPK